MRTMLKTLIAATNLPVRRYAVRFCSSDAQAKPKTDEKQEPEKESEPAKIEVVKKNIVIEKFGSVMTLNIDRQKTRNSLDIVTLNEMTEAINAFDNDPEAKVLVFNGEGGSFCSGFNMDDIGTHGYNNLKDAALTSLIGLSPALDLLITGRLISGVDAHRLGLACKLTSTGTALGESIKLAKSLVKFPTNAMVMDKMAAINSQLNPNSEESIGKHGKFYKLKELPLKDWELEDTEDEVTIKLNESNTEKEKAK
ncbi:hypothetical protein HF086_007710 [Spodoptera exigua]|uniref:Enoyl-CoA hydratase n=1 Tax=Spodoptera exigua TaxID=7107 RepID=A0A922SPI4_SPOEX|nr:hypothetical protein HF086_007710 [Spodoptera exigua]